MLHVPPAVSRRGGGLVLTEGDRASNLIKSRLHDPKGPEAPFEPALVCGILGKVDEDDEDSSGHMW